MALGTTERSSRHSGQVGHGRLWGGWGAEEKEGCQGAGHRSSWRAAAGSGALLWRTLRLLSQIKHAGDMPFFCGADNYTSSRYVSVVDSDCAFTTVVTEGDLFDGDKPIVIALANMDIRSTPFGKAALATEWFLGRKEALHGMASYPVRACLRTFSAGLSVRHTQMGQP